MSDFHFASILRGHLAGDKIPKQFVVVEAVQRAPNGKADYLWARELVGQQPSTTA